MLTTTKLKHLVGGEIKAERKTLLDGSASAEILRLLDGRGVLVFPKVDFTDEEQLIFTRTLGEPANQGQHGAILKVTMDKKENANADYLKGAVFWHIDSTTSDTPARASLLSARRLAPIGGQTEFANLYAAYEALPEADKRAFDGLKVVHDQEAAQRMWCPEPTLAQITRWHQIGSKTHSLVWHHKSGRKSLFLGATAFYVEGMDLKASSELLCRLREWATQPQFVYRHEWSVGDLVMWDNHGTMHRAIPYDENSGRMMHRTELVGHERVA